MGHGMVINDHIIFHLRTIIIIQYPINASNSRLKV